MLVGLICEYDMTNEKNLMNSNSNVQRRRRYKQMRMEEDASNKLRNSGWKIFSPTVVCDRIGIRNNQVFFIEFKKSGQKLRENQERIKKLVNNYRIIQY